MEKIKLKWAHKEDWPISSVTRPSSLSLRPHMLFCLLTSLQLYWLPTYSLKTWEHAFLSTFVIAILCSWRHLPPYTQEHGLLFYSVVGSVMAPKDIWFLILGTCKCSLTRQWSFSDVIKFRIWRWKDYLELSKWVLSIIMSVLIRRCRGKWDADKAMWSRKPHTVFLAWEMEKGALSQGT